MNGTLYICATPIGNLEDITLRALKALRECDCIACEDTRHSATLLAHYDIKKPLFSYHEHNEQSRSEFLLQKLADGENIVLISDAGMPCISDPGYIIVNKARERGIPVTVLPGANAGLCALVLSGMKCDRFVFEGFLPKTAKERGMRLSSLKTETSTAIIHESPHHLLKTLEELYKALGERDVAVVREITKIHEECLRFKLSEYAGAVENVKGEFVIILSGAEKQSEELPPPRDHVILLINEGMDKMSAVKAVAKARGVAKNEIYMLVNDL